MAQWYVIIDGQEHGPMSAERLRAAVNKGSVTADTLIRKDDMAAPIAAGKVRGLIKEKSTTRRSRRPGTRAHKAGTGRKERAAAIVHAPEAETSEPNATAGDPYSFDPFEKSENFVKQVEAKEITNNFYLEVLKAFAYPFSPNALAFMAGYVILGLIFVYAGIFLIHAWFGFQYIFFILMMWFVLYALAYAIRIGQRSAAGDLRPPVWPQLGALMDEILGPAALCLAAWIVLRIPYIAYAWCNPDYLPQSQGLDGFLPQLDVYFFHAFDLMFRLPQSAEEYVLAAISALIFPAGMMMVFIKGSLLGLHPLPLFKNVFSIVPEYVTCMVLHVCCYVALMLLWQPLAQQFDIEQTLSFSYLVFDYFSDKSILDVIAVLCLAIIPLFYVCMVQFRLLAVLYYIKGSEFE